MKRNLLLGLIALGVCVSGNAAINTIVEGKITNTMPATIKYRSALKVVSRVERAPDSVLPGKSTVFKVVGPAEPGAHVLFRFDNLGLDIDSEHRTVRCDSVLYACKIVSVRDNCDVKGCVAGFSITIVRK
jgi:hypothetical protein